MNNYLSTSDFINPNLQRERIDKLLVQKYPELTRSTLQEFIKNEYVTYQNKIITKPSVTIPLLHFQSEELLLKIPNNENEVHYVSRGGKKLEAALNAFNLSPQKKIIADVGAGSGGFSDCLLKRGADYIYTLDVGKGQLSPLLLSSPRIKNYEGINIKNPFSLPEKVDWVVGDLSFISLRKVLTNILDLLKSSDGNDEGLAILLFKPQFELTKSKLNKRGVVKNDSIRKEALLDFIQYVLNAHKPWIVEKYIESPLPGKEGNIEYLLLFRKI